MATISPGTGGTLKSTTLEKMAVEAALMLQNLEQASTSATPPNNIAVSFFTGDSVVQIQATFPISVSVSASGQTTINPKEYISPATAFNNGGTTSDLKSTTLVDAVLELFQRLQNLEKTQANAANNVQVTYDTETEIATINAELPVVYGLATDGSVAVQAISYLTTASSNSTPS